MKLSPEQREELVNGLQANDFTQAIHLKGSPENGNIEPSVCTPLKKYILGLMYENLPAFGINRYLYHFSGNHPIKLLLDADASYISDAASKILSSSEETKAAQDKYQSYFATIHRSAELSYCNARGKTASELSVEDREYIYDTTRDIINKELLNVLMDGQQLPEVYEVAHSAPSHEDFTGGRNTDYINFHAHWSHCRTIVGEMLSLDSDCLDVPYENDHLALIMCKDFCATLRDSDAAIFRLKQQGYSHAEIAKQVGYHNPNAITKRLARIKRKWIEFTTTA